MGLSLRFKIILITVAVLIFAIGATAIASSYVFAQAYSDLLQSRTVIIGQGINSQLNRLLELGLPLTDITGFEKQLQDTLDTYDDLTYAMVVDLNGTVLFHNDPSQQNTTITDAATLNAVQSGEEVIQVYSDQTGEFQDVFIPIVDRSEDHVGAIRLGFPTELITQRITQLAVLTGAIALISLTIAIVLFVFALSAWVTNPLTKLITVIQQIISGEQGLTTKVEIDSKDELGELGTAFNIMAAQLNESIETLEHKVAERTQGVETVAALSEKLLSILNLDQLFQELVNQTHSAFGYYYVGVYLVDDWRQNLVISAGVEQAEAEMKEMRHSIPINDPFNLIARAARAGNIIKIDNVREAATWDPNSLLPNTYSEMAVPIIVDERVAGVLDVQEDEIAGLDEGDANLLRLLANQVAVAIRNAQLFNEAETALAEANATQERYLERSWDKSRVAPQTSQYLYTQPTAEPLDEQGQKVLVKVQQKVVGQTQQAVIDDNSTEGVSMVAPVILRDQAIGTLQLHTSNRGQPWTEDDLSLLEAIAEQFAQAAENLRLFDETRARAGREQTIREITDKLRGAPTLEDLARIAGQELSQLLGVSHSMVKVGVTPKQNSTAQKASQSQTGNKNGE